MKMFYILLVNLFVRIFFTRHLDMCKKSVDLIVLNHNWTDKEGPRLYVKMSVKKRPTKGLFKQRFIFHTPYIYLAAPAWMGGVKIMQTWHFEVEINWKKCPGVLIGLRTIVCFKTNH